MTSQTEAIKIVIGIPTYKRPQGLRKLLESLSKTKAPFTPHILVADNEGAEGAGTKTVHAMVQEGYPFPLTVTAVPERGISHARNALLKEGFETLGADFLAMVDDDERVEPDWIAALVRMQEETGADVVWGWVLPEFETPPPTWADRLVVYYRIRHPDGKTNTICGTASVLFSKSVYGPDTYFDNDFSLSGGGDQEFFERLKMRGTSFAFTSKAVSHEYYTASRINKKWACKRAFRFGSTYMRVFKMHYDARHVKKWAVELIKIPAVFMIGFFMSTFYFWNPPKQMKGLLLMVRQAGKIAAIFGGYGREYAVTHGK